MEKFIQTGAIWLDDMRVSPDATVKLHLGGQLVMGLNPEQPPCIYQGEGCVQLPSLVPLQSEEPLALGYVSFSFFIYFS